MINNILVSLLIGPLTFEPASKDVIDAVTGIEITSGDRSGFQISFAVSPQSRIMTQLLPSGYFDPMRRVIVVVTLLGTPYVLADGVITRHDLSPSDNPGESTFTITGTDITQVMDLIDFSTLFTYPAMPPEAMVAFILAKYAMYGIIPMIIPSVLLYVPNPIENWPKHKGTDLEFVRHLASNVGYVFYITPGPIAGTNTAYWGPEIKVGSAQPALTINMGPQSNVESMSFNFDGMAKTLYILSLQLSEVPGRPQIPIPVPDISPINPPLGAKLPIPFKVKLLDAELKKDEDYGLSTSNVIQAASKALGAASRASDVISGSGSLDVLRYGRLLQARQLVGVRGVGGGYDGLYYVKSVTHSIQRGEYKQRFTLTRNATIPFSNQVNV